jgi:hypothetical protein
MASGLDEPHSESGNTQQTPSRSGFRLEVGDGTRTRERPDHNQEPNHGRFP